jgi:hypothetical protein
MRLGCTALPSEAAQFDPLFAADVRRQWVIRMPGFHHWRWHLDQMCVLLCLR